MRSQQPSHSQNFPGFPAYFLELAITVTVARKPTVCSRFVLNFASIAQLSLHILIPLSGDPRRNGNCRTRCSNSRTLVRQTLSNSAFVPIAAHSGSESRAETQQFQQMCRKGVNAVFYLPLRPVSKGREQLGGWQCTTSARLLHRT